MQTRHIRGIALLAFATTVAAEPPKLAEPPVATAATPAAPATKPPLKLRAGDVRHYMLPGEYREAIEAPDAETTTVVVQGQKLLPMKSLQPIPGGIITPIWAPTG